MPTYDDLCAAIESLDLPYARVQFDTRDPDNLPNVPFVVLMPTTTNHQQAGDAIAYHVWPYNVELYTDGSNMALEGAVQSALEAAGFVPRRYTLGLDDNVVETVYSVACSD